MMIVRNMPERLMKKCLQMIQACQYKKQQREENEFL